MRAQSLLGNEHLQDVPGLRLVTKSNHHLIPRFKAKQNYHHIPCALSLLDICIPDIKACTLRVI
jgi:hypothetical protein